jgi:molybdate transport system substrate-binding protein
MDVRGQGPELEIQEEVTGQERGGCDYPLFSVDIFTNIGRGIRDGTPRADAGMHKTILKVLLTCGLLFTGLIANGAPITVFAAASLTDSLKQIAAAYEKQTGEKVVFNFAASSFLARQIEEGAPADIFFSADEARMDALEKKGLLLENTRKSRLSNSLVIVVETNSPLSIGSAWDVAGAKVGHIALADPKTVPAGIYAKEYFQKFKLWAAVEPKVIPVDNVRAALSAVESGDVEAGMVYKTDAAISKKVKVAYEIPPADTPHISYPMAMMKDSPQRQAARKFLAYLDSEAAGRIFERFGFIVRK